MGFVLGELFEGPLVQIHVDYLKPFFCLCLSVYLSNILAFTKNVESIRAPRRKFSRAKGKKNPAVAEPGGAWSAYLPLL